MLRRDPGLLVSLSNSYLKGSQSLGVLVPAISPVFTTQDRIGRGNQTYRFALLFLNVNEQAFKRNCSTKEKVSGEMGYTSELSILQLLKYYKDFAKKENALQVKKKKKNPEL
jgi:hypothetical protein